MQFGKLVLRELVPKVLIFGNQVRGQRRRQQRGFRQWFHLIGQAVRLLIEDFKIVTEAGVEIADVVAFGEQV